MTQKNALIDPDDSVLLMIDHQSGLLQFVKDIDLRELRLNVGALLKAATLDSVPVVVSASVPEGQNGPLLPEVFDNVPNAVYVQRHGMVNAWDVAAFRGAVEETGRRTLIIAGITTSVCVAQPALAALAEGYRVYAVIDASGDYSEVAQRVSIERMSRAGVGVIDVVAVLAELQRTWNRADAAEWGALYGMASPGYAAVIESVMRAQAEATGGKEANAEVNWATARGNLV